MLCRATLLLFLTMLVCFAVVGAGEAWADVPYDPAIKLEGLDDDKLFDSLKDISQLVALKKKVPETRAALQRRIEDDVQRLVSVMEAAGYWQAQIDDTVRRW